MARNFTIMDGGGSPAAEKPPTLAERAYGRLCKVVMSSIDRVAEAVDERDVKDTVYDPSDFPWVEAFKASTPVIQAELAEVLNDLDGVPDFRSIDDRMKKVDVDSKWKILQFFLFGHRFERNCARCPETVKALEKIPGMQTALFSILRPDTHVKPHYGELKGTIRGHLPLIVPTGGSCALQVAEHVFEWQDTDIVLFDHTAYHAAWNETDSIRVVLLFDVAKKLPFPWHMLNRAALPLVTRTRYMKESIRRVEDAAGEHPRADRPA